MPRSHDRVPFNDPALAGNELLYLQDAIERRHLSGDGFYTRRCEELLQSILGARTLLTTSCTHALEMAALLLDLAPGDEFLLPTFTFPSTANAFVLRGATPLFLDIRADTLNLDETRIAEAITTRTRAIVVVHYAGVACEMDEILRIAGEHGLAVIEDNAHGLFGAYRGQPLGTFGAMSTLSFHETKNVFCGEGGALAINDARFVARAEILREKGTNRSAFFRGEVDKYSWQDLGSSYVMSDMLAAFLLAQLERRDAIQEARARLHQRYASALAEWAARREVQLPSIPAHCTPAHHLFHLVMPSAEEQTRFLRFMNGRGVQAISHYRPLHSSPMGQRLGGRTGACPVAESTSDRIVRLPFHASMTEETQQRVIDAVLAY